MNEMTKRLIDLDKKYLWHPFTQMADWLDETPVVIESGDGFYLIDTEGNRYIDGVSSLWCNVHGHRVKKVDDAIRDQLDKIAHSTLLGLGQPKSIELAEKLVQIAHRSRNLKGHGLDEGISTRLLVYAGQMIAQGVDPKSACQMTLVTPLTDDPDMRETLQAAGETFFV